MTVVVLFFFLLSSFFTFFIVVFDFSFLLSPTGDFLSSNTSTQPHNQPLAVRFPTDGSGHAQQFTHCKSKTTKARQQISDLDQYQPPPTTTHYHPPKQYQNSVLTGQTLMVGLVCAPDAQSHVIPARRHHRWTHRVWCQTPHFVLVMATEQQFHLVLVDFIPIGTFGTCSRRKECAKRKREKKGH
jgi:hypothetical protein